MTESQPPVPPHRPRTLERSDGTSIVDPWFGLRERDEEMLAHLEAENAYASQVLAATTPLRDRVFEEIRTRTLEDDAAPPVLVPARREVGATTSWLYYRRTLEGLQYPIHARRPAGADVADVADLPDELRRAVDPRNPPDDEVVLFDENTAAEGHAYFRLGNLAVSPDQTLAVEAIDITGGEVYELRVRDLATGELLSDRIERATGAVAWFDDGRTFLYTVPDDAWRPHQVWRHRLGTDAADDEMILEETDERFWLGIGRTRSDRFLAIHAGSRVTSEWHLIEAGDPQGAPREVVGRVDGVEVDLDHRGELLYLVTNADGAVDFKLCVVPVGNPDRSGWQDLVAHRPGIRLEGADVFADHLVLTERTDATTRLRVLPPTGGEGDLVELPEEICAVGLASNPVFATRTIRYVYTSMITPLEIVDLDRATGDRFVVKRQEVRGYERDRFVTWREWAPAPDGTLIPISLVRRADVELDGSAPCVLYGYGAYEISIDPAFSVSRLSLLERGVVFAVAHVRGGGEMGRAWYEQGRMVAKTNTFTDFIACAYHLVSEGVTTHERLAIRGGSAGGMLIGAVLNLRPQLCAAAVAEVPFVDVVTTMSDASIPLTVIEYDEWGDPADPATCSLIRSYSPYDNVVAAPRPAVFVTAGLNDPRVQVWEPVKWVAKLREHLTEGGPVLLRTEMGAGHAGRSGRYDAWRDEAEILAFVLDRLGVAADDKA